MQKIRALAGAAPLADNADEPGEQPEATEAPKPGKKVVNAKGDEQAQLQELAKKLGFELDGGKLLPSEVAKFREYKRKQRETFESEMGKRLSEFSEKEKTHSARVEKADQLEKAMSVGDYEGIAKLLGHEDWNKLQEAVIAQVSDPNYKKMRELERWKEDQEKQRSESERQQQEHQKQQAQMRARQEYAQGLSKTMSGSKDPLLAALHDEPFIVQAVMNLQGQNYDGQSVPPPERVLRMAAKGAAKTLHDELHGLYLKMHRVFGAKQAPAANVNAPQKKPAPKSAPVPPSATAEASGPGNWGARPKKDWFEYQRAKMQEAIAAEEKERAGTRR